MESNNELKEINILIYDVACKTRYGAKPIMYIFFLIK